MCHQGPNFDPICSPDNRLHSGHFQNTPPNGLQMMLNSTRWNVHLICVTGVPEHWIPLCFSLWLAVLNYRPFWVGCNEWLQNDLKHYMHYKVKSTPCIRLCVQHTISFRLTDPPFSRHRPFGGSAPSNDAKMTLNITRPNVSHICVTRVPESQHSVVLTLRATNSDILESALYAPPIGLCAWVRMLECLQL